MQNLMPPVDTSDNAFHDGDPTTGQLGTIVTAEWLNNVQGATRDTQAEIIAVLTKAGMQPNPQKKNQLAEAIGLIIGSGDYVTNSFLKLELLKKIDKADIAQQLGNDTGKVPSLDLVARELGKKASTAVVDGKLTKDQNGADIPDKPKFIENLGLGEAAKSGLKQGTGTSKTDVMSQDGSTKYFALKQSKEAIKTGNHTVVSDDEYAYIELINSAGERLSIESLPHHGDFSGNVILRDAEGKAVSVIKIPRKANSTFATLADLTSAEKKSVQAFRYSSVRAIKTAVNYWAPAAEGEFVIGIRTSLDSAGIWIISDVKVATLQVFIDGKWVNIQNA